MIDYEKRLDKLILEVDSPATKKARAAGLEPAGFGKWRKKGDPKRRIVARSSHDGKELIYNPTVKVPPEAKHSTNTPKTSSHGNLPAVQHKSPHGNLPAVQGAHSNAPKGQHPTPAAHSQHPTVPVQGQHPTAPPGQVPPSTHDQNPMQPGMAPMPPAPDDGSKAGPIWYEDEKDMLASKANELEKKHVVKGENTRNRVGGHATPGGDSKIKDEIIKKGWITGLAAPGNPGSCLNEIFTGEIIHRIFEDPRTYKDANKLAMSLYNEYKKTGLFQQNLGGVQMKKPKDPRLVGLDTELFAKVLSTTKAGISETLRLSQGMTEMGWKLKDVEIHHFYGHDESKKEMVAILNKVGKGKIFTPEGTPMPLDVAIEFAKTGGGGENPTDTNIIVRNRNGDLMFAATSNKLTPNDIQHNSSPIQELAEKGKMIKAMGLGSKNETEALGALKKSIEKIDEIEKDLRSSLKPVADFLLHSSAQKQLNQMITVMKTPDKKDRKKVGRFQVQVIKKFSVESLNKKDPSGGLTKGASTLQQFMKGANPNWKPGTAPTEMQKTRAWLYSCSNGKMNDNDTKLLTRAPKNIEGIPTPDDVIEKARIAVIKEELNCIRKLDNYKTHGGLPLGTHLEGKSLAFRLHLGAAFTDSEKHGVFKYSGFFKLNMAGILVGPKQLQHCLGVTTEAEYSKQLKIKKATNIKDKSGRVTGSNALVYTLDKQGKEHPIAIRTVRSKQGASGRLGTAYQWHPDIQKCFGSNQ